MTVCCRGPPPRRPGTAYQGMAPIHWVGRAVLAFLVSFIAPVLHGCGGGDSGGDSGHRPTSWKTNPIEVRGNHLYDAVTHKTFFAKGIAFPNIGGNNVKDWVYTLRRIKRLSNEINVVRLYVLPDCIWETIDGWCFSEFMQEADALGMYVLVAGTGTVTGYWPATGFGSANECYSQGKVLNHGRAIVQRMNYPNTLAIVLGNEFLHDHPPTWNVISVLKAYARDLKKYMKMCNDDKDSPSFGKMRQIPLAFAAIDQFGDHLTPKKAEYLFCGDPSKSIDIFGVNEQRWCDPNAQTAYNGMLKWVADGNFPGAFILSEMGCPKNTGYHGTRDWKQVRGFFKNFTAFDGFFAYAYWNAGAPEFNMFAGGSSTAEEYQDGKNFFDALEDVGEDSERAPGTPVVPVCATHFGYPAAAQVEIESLDDIHSYDDDQFPAAQCAVEKRPAALMEVTV